MVSRFPNEAITKSAQTLTLMLRDGTAGRSTEHGALARPRPGQTHLTYPTTVKP